MEREKIRQRLEQAKERCEEHGLQITKVPFVFHVNQAKDVFEEAFEIAIDGKMTWLKEYGEIVKWLEGNDGKGLFLMGKCGIGKSVVARNVLPLIFNGISGRIIHTWTAKEYSRLDEIPKSDITIIDDMGTEGQVKHYGTDRSNIEDLVELLDATGKIAIITTNLTPDEIREKYDDRTADRIRANFKIVGFSSDYKSMRR